MSIDNIAREGFQLYRQTQEKERLIDKIRSSLRADYVFAALPGVVALSEVVTLSSGGGTGHPMYQGDLTRITVDAIIMLVSAGFLVYRGRVIADKYKQIGRAEAELEQIKENPAYKKLDLAE